MNRELSDDDVVNIWQQGLKKPLGDLKGFAQYRLPSGMVRLVYSLKERVNLAEYIVDPFFQYQKSILGDISTYTCKVLNLSTLQSAVVGDEVRNSYTKLSFKLLVT